MLYRICLEDIGPSGLDLRGSLALEDVAAYMDMAEDPQAGFATALVFEARLEKAEGLVVARGRVKAGLRVACCRCLEEFGFPAEEGFKVVFAPLARRGPLKERINAEDLEREYFEGQEFDLGPALIEHALLALPIQPVCSRSCRGLCPGCGQNLNEASCLCPEPEPHPGLKALARIKNDLPPGEGR